MKKVLLIAFYFNQTNEIASKRLRGLAEYLPKFDWEAIVIVPDLGFYPCENANLNCKIITTEYEDMFSHYLAKFRPSGGKSKNLKDSDYQIDDCKSGFSNSSKDLNNGELGSNGKLKDSSSFKNPLLSKAISIAGEIFAYPDGMKYWHDHAFKSACQLIETENIEAIISSSWPVTCHTIAKDLKEKYNIPWIADLRDLWNLNPYISHTRIRSHFEKNLERKTFKDADVLTVTTELAAETLASLHPNKQIVPILSGYSEEDFRIIGDVLSENNGGGNNRNNNALNENPPISVSGSKLRFIYAGSLYAGKRDPTLLFKAIRELEDENKMDSSKIAIDFYGDSGNLDKIANKYNLLDIVNISGKIPHSDVLKKEASSDVLLLISWNDEKEKMFIPGKIYEYFALKKPVLSIGYKEGSLKDLIDRTNIGYHVSTLEDTKDVLLNFYNEFSNTGHVTIDSNLNIQEYSMETMAGRFAKLLDELV